MTSEKINEKMLKDISDIKTALLGDLDGNIGLVARVTSIERKMKAIDKLIWKIFGSAVTGGGGVVVFLKILESVLK